jgi:methylase of polypeptide subunit release factors
MGTGAFAVIGLALWRRGCRVVSSDIHPEILERARANVERNGAELRLVQSRFFDAVLGDFEGVTFNPPYIPSHLAQNPTFARPFDFQSNGGADGSSVIEAFFDAFSEKGGSARGYLGINELWVSGARVLALLGARPGLALERTDRFLGLPFYVLVIRRAAAS